MSSSVERTLSKVVEAKNGWKLIQLKHMVDTEYVDTSSRKRKTMWKFLLEGSFLRLLRNVVNLFNNLWIGSNWLFPPRKYILVWKASVVDLTRQLSEAVMFLIMIMCIRRKRILLLYKLLCLLGLYKKEIKSSFVISFHMIVCPRGGTKSRCSLVWIFPSLITMTASYHLSILNTRLSNSSLDVGMPIPQLTIFQLSFVPRRM
ncbi:UNVERIFIED_CONTAM: hypothetical protein NCL1_35199 [Trichonephila clavipes]